MDSQPQLWLLYHIPAVPALWRLGPEGHPWLHREFETSLGYVRPCFKKLFSSELQAEELMHAHQLRAGPESEALGAGNVKNRE